MAARPRLQRRSVAVLFAAAVMLLATSAAAELEYVEMLTKGATATDPLPILVALHGLGDSPEAFRLLLDDLPVRARVILPRAPTPYGNAGGGKWFDLHKGDEEVASGVSKAAGEVAEMIGILHERFGGPPRVVVTGFSQGGILAFALAAAHPERVAAAVPVAGFLPIPLWPATRPKHKPLPKILALHGATDDVVPIQSAQWSIEALRSNGYDAQLRSYPELKHTIGREERADLFAALISAINELAPPSEEQPEEKPAQAAGQQAQASPATPASSDAKATVPARPDAPAPDVPASENAASELLVTAPPTLPAADPTPAAH